MKLKKLLLYTLAAGAMTFVTNTAPAQEIVAKLSISGQAIVNTNGSVLKGSNQQLTPTKYNFKNKDLVNLLNASAIFRAYLNCYTEGGLTNLPPNTSFGYDIYGYDIVAILPTGGIIYLTGYDCTDTYRRFADMDWDDMSANYTYNADNGNGSETDQLAEWWIEIDDYNVPLSDLYLQGQMQLKWSAGKVSGGYRSLSVSANFTGSGDFEVKGYYGTGTGKASGSGKAGSSGVYYTYWPFWNWD